MNFNVLLNVSLEKWWNVKIGRLLCIPRRLRKIFYKYYNRFLFWINGVEYGKNMDVYNYIYFNKHPKAKIIIGDDFTFTSGEAFNPLCRNMRGCIVAERAGSVIEIGHHAGMSSPCVWIKERLTVGNYVKIGGDCIIMDSDAHNLDWRVRSSQKMFSAKESMDCHTARCAPIVIEDHVLIGTRCIILKGVTIGAHSVIAAGSVVTKSIPADCIAGGNPARVIKKIE